MCVGVWVWGVAPCVCWCVCVSGRAGVCVGCAGVWCAGAGIIMKFIFEFKITIIIRLIMRFLSFEVFNIFMDRKIFNCSNLNSKDNYNFNYNYNCNDTSNLCVWCVGVGCVCVWACGRVCGCVCVCGCVVCGCGNYDYNYIQKIIIIIMKITIRNLITIIIISIL